MIIFALPYNPDFSWTSGWGTLLDAIQRQAPARFDRSWGSDDYPVNFNAPLLTMVQSVNMLPMWPNLRSSVRNVAIAVPVERYLLKKYILNARRYWDHVVAGSTWAENMIRDAGYSDVTTIIHAPDPDVYKPKPQQPSGTFTIFSAGKLELRKSQDIVIQAVGHMMRRYRDVHLIADWFNPWPETAKSIRAAPLFRQYANGTPLQSIMRQCGIDFARTRILQTEFSTPEEHLTDKLEAMWESDVGLFPNRAEACPNSLMVETMACGRPVIALCEHGQRDVLDPDSPLTCHAFSPLAISDGKGEDQCLWFEPDLDEVIAKLEWAYEHREQLPELGMANVERLKPFSLEATAAKYIAVCEGQEIAASV